MKYAEDASRPSLAARLLRPKVALPAMFALVVVVAILVPEWGTLRSGDPRPTTHSAQSMGAQLFFDLTRRLGWKPERRERREVPSGSDIIHAVIGAETPFQRSDVGQVLARVRDGAGLLVVGFGRSSVFFDSLAFRSGAIGYAPPADTLLAPCPPRSAGAMHLWFGSRALLTGVRWRGDLPDSAITLLSVTPDRSVRAPRSMPAPAPVPALVGFTLGRGRVVVATDADIFRNDALRGCMFGLDVAAVRAVEYLSAGGDRRRDRIVFDEFHHGYGEQPGTFRTIGAYLSKTPSGRTFAQLCVAGLVLLAALAPRAIAPRHITRIERRSPFEHVDALSRAYAQVGATRTATLRLVRGLRRRVEPRAFRATHDAQDTAFLDRIDETTPGLAADVALVRRATQNRVSPSEFVQVGEALHRIENSLTRL